MTKENILFVFKDRKLVTKNDKFWCDKFKLKYNVETLFINDHLNFTNDKIIGLINNSIETNSIKIILFEGDHAHIIDNEFVKKISNKVKKGIFLGDDMVWHLVNLISAQECDFVLTSEPISVLKFKELGLESFYVPIEANGNIFKDRKLKKIIDVLHFGRQKTIRKDYINYLEKNGINVKSVTPYDEESNSMEKLAHLINQSKIIINFAQSVNGNRHFNHLKIFENFYQTKGRIQVAGISNVLCVSEYSASSELLYPNNELPFFKSKEECLKKIKFYLSNENELKKATELFHLKSLEFEDSKYIIQIKKFMDNVEIKDKKNFKTPFWYKYLFLKQKFRLRFKKNQLSSFFGELFSIISSTQKYNFVDYLRVSLAALLIFVRYIPFFIIKKIISIFK